MEPLSQEERRAFLAIYGYEEESDSVAESLIESLIDRGLLARNSDDTLDFTEAGNQLYDELMPDEPYEGV